MRAAVIGAGLSGLAAAHRLKELSAVSGAGVSVSVFEKTERAGGKIGTVRDGGYLLETGPNGFLDAKTSTLELSSSLGLENVLMKADRQAARRYIYKDGRLLLLPDGPKKFLLSPVLSAAGKFRVALETLVPAKKSEEDESVASFARRRIGSEALENLVGPMVSGIYAGDPERLSLRSAFPRMAQLEAEYGGLIKAMISLKRGGAPSGVLTSFEGGMGRLTEALASSSGRDLATGREVLGVSKTGDKWTIAFDGGAETFDAVIPAVPAYVLGRIFPAAAPFCEKVPYPPVTVVHLGYKKPANGRQPDGFGFLAAGKDRPSVLGAVFSSNIFPGRAPEGSLLITAMTGGAKAPGTAALADQELVAAVRRDLEAALGLSAGPELVRVFRHERAIPNYPVGYPEVLAGLERKIAEQKGMFLAGNAFYGVGVNDAARRGREAAEQAFGFLREKRAK